MNDERLAYIDQATFLSWRATGRAQLIQYVWLYERPVDMARLDRFHRDFGHGIAGRLIEPSVLPFGRHRWVAAPGPPGPLDVSPTRPPDRLADWIDERSETPIDPVRGPGWHMGVLPMTDGSTAVSLVASHCLQDGGVSFRRVVETLGGDCSDYGYPPPGSRTRRRAVTSDLRQVIQDLPELGRTLSRALRFAYRSRGAISSSGASRPADAGTAAGTLVVPAVSAVVDVADWDARAGSLGGTTYALLAGVAARLGERLGRADPADRSISLQIALSDRGGFDDRRANALKIASATVDPGGVTTDLTAARAAVRAALSSVWEAPDDKHALLPITPYVPKRAVRKTADVLFGDLPVSCSNLGDVPVEIPRVDGADADMVLFRPVDQNVTRESLERAGGQLILAAGRVAGTMSIGVIGYEVGAPNTREWLADNVVRTLADFDLKGTIV